MFSDFPNLHPLVVHFPIILILLSAALQAVLVFKDWPPVKWITLVVMGGGFAGALAASTVFHAMPMGLSPKATAVFSAHEQYASYALWLSGITLLLGGVGEFFQIRRRAYEVLVLVSALAAAGAVSVAGHHGAQLVYVEGVGPKGNLLMKGDHHGHSGMEEMQNMDMSAPNADDHGQEIGHQDDGHDGPAINAGPKAKPELHNAPGLKGMDMGGQASQPEMSEMPGMQGMSTKPASKKKPLKAMPAMEGMDGMGNMADMPGMKAASPKQPNQTMPAMGNMKDMPGMEKGQAMPATGTMPGMNMPANPMDKFRFEDNNPARNKPKNAKK